eukprot:TRINITY_DN321_c0_g1_i2.p1 TRINITY_DN321_c0_g1~~TRINITY_DN321_c0_g1_i2.p1  ORF type:complete len:250 (-),score=80.42 TRINITY_DN321_c0_g1_i2:239-988(-)
MKTTLIVLIALLFASCVVAVEESTNAQEQINVEQSNESLTSDADASDASEDSEDAEDEVDAVEDEADESDATDDSDDSDDSEQESAVEDDSEDSEDSDDSENDEDSDDDSDDEESLEDSSEEEEQVNQNFGPINAVVANMSAEDRQKHSDEIQKLLAEEEAERKELLAKNELTDEDLRWRFRWRKAYVVLLHPLSPFQLPQLHHTLYTVQNKPFCPPSSLFRFPFFFAEKKREGFFFPNLRKISVFIHS